MHQLGPDKRPGFKEIDVVDGYDKWALTYDCDPNPLIAVEEPVTVNLIGDVKGKTVLDIGCGTGRYCKFLADIGAEVTGIDPSHVMIEEAKKKLSLSRQFDLHQGNLTEIDLPSRYFDLIISALTFCHISDIESVFEVMDMILKEEGQIVISDFHPYWPVFGHGYTEFFDEKGQEYRITNYPHLFEEYFTLCVKNGLQIVDVKEPKITSELINDFSSLSPYIDLPLALVLKIERKSR